ncbi:catalase, partial [Pseudomonas syringae]|nr:catalase [Pseudomonas syringae]
MTTQNLTVQPLPFQPSFEVVPDDEAQTSKELVEAMHSILETTYQDTGHAIRSVHAKAHGLLHGQIQVYGDLPEPLAQGAFASPGNFPLVIH